MIRTINPDLQHWITGRMTTPSYPTHTGLMLAAARALIGVTEAKDAGVVAMIRETLAADSGQPWCMDFVQTCIAFAETPSFPSPVPASQGVLDTWNRSPHRFGSLSEPPKIGDIILWQEQGTQQGHCGLITGMDSLMYSTIEGNTSDIQTIDRNGRGVWAKRRARGGTRTFTELGFIRPF